MSEGLRALFAPRHVAVVGASRTPGKTGHMVVRNLIAAGFPGEIYPVNPAGGQIEELASYKSIAEISQPADCAILVLPAGQCVEATRACAARGVRSVVVGASGFAESGTAEGRAWQEEILAIARGAGMRLLGPNTNGIYNRAANFSLGYNVAHGYDMPLGPVSVIAHSGAVFAGIARTLLSHRCGLAKFVPVGNEADLDMLDVLDLCIEDEETRVIGLAIEALSSGERFRALAAKAARRGKTIVALKLGRSAAGAGAALAHSSRLAGSARAYDALFAACAVANVRSVEALAGACAFLAGRPLDARGTDQRLIAVSTSGAGGEILADHAAERGLELAGHTDGAWGADIDTEVSCLKRRGMIRNPIDLGALEDVGDLDAVYRTLEKSGFTGPTVGFAHNLPSQAQDRAVLGAYAARLKRTGAPIVVVAPGGIGEEQETAYRSAGLFLVHETALAFEVLTCHFTTLPPPGIWQERAQLSAEMLAALAQLRAKQPGNSILPETDSATILRAFDVPLVDTYPANTTSLARVAAEQAGYPVVLKGIAPSVAHKHAAGLVIASIGDDTALMKAHGEIAARLKSGPQTASIILQPMLKSRIELLVGVSCETNLGHFFVLGLGGVLTEALDDVMLLPVGLEAAALRARVAASRVGRLLAALDPAGTAMLLDEFMAVLASLQRFVLAAADVIESVELNPLLVTDANVMRAVDALITFVAGKDGRRSASVN